MARGPVDADAGSPRRLGDQLHRAPRRISTWSRNALAIPGGYDQITVIISTQNPNGDQAQIARVLGVKANQVTVCVEQIGGGFGGKQNRAVFIGAAAAVAARKLRRPVRVAFDRSTDTQLIGKRHPYLGELPRRLLRGRHARTA